MNFDENQEASNALKFLEMYKAIGFKLWKNEDISTVFNIVVKAWFLAWILMKLKRF